MKIKLSDIKVKSFVTSQQLSKVQGASGPPCNTMQCSLKDCASWDYPGCGYVSIPGTICATGVQTCDGMGGACLPTGECETNQC